MSLLLPLGDSLTNGNFLPDDGGYRISMGALRPDDQSVGRVVSGPASPADWRNCEAYPGEGLVYLAARAAEVAPASWDAALVLVGTAQAILESRAVLAPSLVSLVTAALGAGLVYLAVPPPIVSGADYPQAEVLLAGYRQQARELAESRASTVLVDLYSGFPRGETSDGVHPTATGYAWMADRWAAALATSSGAWFAPAVPVY